jgi:serine/threonine protein phosphatase PrpC
MHSNSARSKLTHNLSIASIHKEQQLTTKPRELLKLAEQKTSDIKGASTCTFLTLDGDKKLLYGCNIGDSGFILLRKDASTLRTIARSNDQWHDYDMPFNVFYE